MTRTNIINISWHSLH